MVNELKLEQVITNVMINHIGEEGRHIGEGGCPRIQWYALRNELIKAITAWNTRPAAPVEGLETVLERPYLGSLVTRSQAETIIAAERADHDATRELLTAAVDDYNTALEQRNMTISDLARLEADNAAMTARVKELEHDLKSYQEPVINAENEKIDLQFKVIDLETQLAAANKRADELEAAWLKAEALLSEAKP